MPDLNEIIAGTVEDVVSVVDMLSIDDLTALKALEEAGKKRKGIFAAIDAAIAALQVVSPPPVANTSSVADDNLSTTTPETPASPAPSIDLSHPALDTDLRAGTTAVQNQIDFNNPYQGGREVVEAALAASVEN